jgi:predicted exporter
MVINKKHGYSTVAQIATFCIYGLSAVMCTVTWAVAETHRREPGRAVTARPATSRSSALDYGRWAVINPQVGLKRTE